MRSTTGFVLALLMSHLGATAGAQDITAPPSRGTALFQGNQTDTDSGQVLSVSLSAFEVLDDNILGADAFGSPLAQRTGVRGSYTTTRTSLFYARRASRISFSSNGSAGFSYYPNLRDTDVSQPVDSYQGFADLAGRFRRTRFQISESISYEPFFMLQALPSRTTFEGLGLLSPDVTSPLLPLGFSPQVALLTQPSTQYGSAASFGVDLGRRTSVEVNSGYEGSTYQGDLTNVTSESAGVSLGYSASRRTRLHGAYTYRQATYRRTAFPTRDFVNHDIDLGASYSKQLSRTRGFGISVGSGASVMDDTPTTDADIAMRRRRQVMGYSALSVQVARSWMVQGEFRRSLQLLQGFTQPYFGNAVNAGVTGTFSRRLNFTATGRYSQGDVGFEAGSRSYDTRSGSVSLGYALSRKFELVAEYQSSEYSFGRDVELPLGLARKLDRNALRVGVTYGDSFLRHRQPAPAAP